MSKPKKPQCYNCKFSGDAFKVAGITHHHCHGPEYEAKDNAGEYISPWDTLREWWDTCEDHQLKEPAAEQVA